MLFAFRIEVFDAVYSAVVAHVIRETIERARISAPCTIASGTWVINVLAFAPTLQPCRQNPR